MVTHYFCQIQYQELWKASDSPSHTSISVSFLLLCSLPLSTGDLLPQGSIQVIFCCGWASSEPHSAAAVSLVSFPSLRPLPAKGSPRRPIPTGVPHRCFITCRMLRGKWEFYEYNVNKNWFLKMKLPLYTACRADKQATWVINACFSQS